MKNFKIISEELNAIKNAGYKLDTSDKTHTDFDGTYMWLDGCERENMIDNLIDGFYDLDGK